MIRLSIPDMSCGHCEKIVREAVKEVDENARVTVDLNSPYRRHRNGAAAR